MSGWGKLSDMFYVVIIELQNQSAKTMHYIFFFLHFSIIVSSHPVQCDNMPLYFVIMW